MGLVQSCCGSRVKDERGDIDNSYHASMIEGKLSRLQLQRYSELYDVLEKPQGEIKLVINDQVYQAQLPLIQDEVIVMNAKTPTNRTFIKSENWQIVSEVTTHEIKSPYPRSRAQSAHTSRRHSQYNHSNNSDQGYPNNVIGTPSEDGLQQDNQGFSSFYDNIAPHPTRHSTFNSNNQGRGMYQTQAIPQSMIIPPHYQQQNYYSQTMNQPPLYHQQQQANFQPQYYSQQPQMQMPQQQIIVPQNTITSANGIGYPQQISDSLNSRQQSGVSEGRELSKPQMPVIENIESIKIDRSNREGGALVISNQNFLDLKGKKINSSSQALNIPPSTMGNATSSGQYSLHPNSQQNLHSQEDFISERASTDQDRENSLSPPQKTNDYLEQEKRRQEMQKEESKNSRQSDQTFGSLQLPPKLSLEPAQSSKQVPSAIAQSNNNLAVNLKPSPQLGAESASGNSRKARLMRLQTGAGLKPSQAEMKKKEEQKNQAKEVYTTHLAYVFSSPLVIELSKGQYVEDKLDEISFKAEFEAIHESLQSSNKAIKYMYTLGTNISMPTVLDKNLLALHFSGHGLQNTRKSFNGMGNANIAAQIAGKGDILVMEGPDSGNSDFFFGKDLIYNLTPKKTKYKFVIIASCHSEMIGKIFEQCYAEHVFCVQKDKQLNDRAAVEFARRFYEKVFNPDYTVCQAYEAALRQIEMSQGLQSESKLYVKFTYPLHDPEHCKVKMADFVSEGQVACINEQVKHEILPTNPTSWIPRSLDMYHIIQKLFSKDSRIVQVFGVPGSGKSALIKRVTNYLAERLKYPGGIIYCDWQNIKTSQEGFLELIDQTYAEKNQEERDIKYNKDLGDKEIMAQLLRICHGPKEILFVLDNCDDVLSYDKDIFVEMYVKKLVNKKDKIKILFSSSVCLMDDIDGFVVKNVHKLPIKKAKELFIKKIPADDVKKRVLSQDSMIDLDEFTMQEKTIEVILSQGLSIKELQNKRYCRKKGNKDCPVVKSHTEEQCAMLYLDRHPLFEIISQPLPLCLAASSLKNKNGTIRTVFENLLQANQNQQNSLDDQLIVFYMSVFKMIEKSSPLALEILYVISQSATGLHFLNLGQLFQLEEVPLRQYLDVLEESALITAEDDIFRIQNIIGKFVELCLARNEHQQIQYNRMLASFYLDVLTNIKQMESEEQLQYSIPQIVEFHEKNITKCLNYLINQKFPTTAEEFKQKHTIGADEKLIGKSAKDILNHQASYRVKGSKTHGKTGDKPSRKARMGKFKNSKEDSVGTQEVFLADEGLLDEAQKKQLAKLKTFVKRPSVDENNLNTIVEELNIEKKKYRNSIMHQSPLMLQKNQKSVKSQIDEMDEEEENETESNRQTTTEEAFITKTSGDELELENNQEGQQNESRTRDDVIYTDAEEEEVEQLQLNEDPTETDAQPFEMANSQVESVQEQTETPFDRSNFGGIDISVNRLTTLSKHQSERVSDINLQSQEMLSQTRKDSLYHKATSSVGKKNVVGLKLDTSIGDFKNKRKGGESNLQGAPNAALGGLKFNLMGEQLINVVTKSINQKLQKLSDEVTEKERQQYTNTVDKFSQFIGKMLIKPSEKVNQFINQPERQWSRRPTSSKIKKQVSSVNPGFKKNMSVAGKNAENKLGLSPPQKEGLGADGQPIEVYGNSLVPMLNANKPQRQTSRVSKKGNYSKQVSSASERPKTKEPQPYKPFLDNIRSNTEIDKELGPRCSQPSDDDENSLEDELGDYIDDDDCLTTKTVEVDDGCGEMQILLYHFMSCQALKNRDISEFSNLRDQFKISQMDQLFQNSIELLEIYQMIKHNSSSVTISTKIENLLTSYKKLQSNKGQAITNFFLAYILKNIQTYKTNMEADNYLAQALEKFKLAADEEGKKYCEDLMMIMKNKDGLGNYKKDPTAHHINLDFSSPTSTPLNMMANIGRKTMSVNSMEHVRYQLDKHNHFLNLLLNPVDLEKEYNSSVLNSPMMRHSFAQPVTGQL